MIKTAIGFFLIILGGALLSAVLGGLFGVVVATVSPEFVTGMFLQARDNPTSYAFATGMVMGLFLGSSVTGFACLLSVLLKLIRLRIEPSKTSESAS